MLVRLGESLKDEKKQPFRYEEHEQSRKKECQVQRSGGSLTLGGAKRRPLCVTGAQRSREE